MAVQMVVGLVAMLHSRKKREMALEVQCEMKM